MQLMSVANASVGLSGNQVRVSGLKASAASSKPKTSGGGGGGGGGGNKKTKVDMMLDDMAREKEYVDHAREMIQLRQAYYEARGE